MPAIIDHKNGGFTLWESGAILSYLVETYDKEHKFSHATVKERFPEQQWLFFQASGQGPYYGQAFWFAMFHHEKLPSAIERYLKEAKRVMAVIDSHLAEMGSQYLVLDKMTYADLSFIPWHFSMAGSLLKDYDWHKEVPHYAKWMDSMTSRPVTKKVLGDFAAAAASAHARKWSWIGITVIQFLLRVLPSVSAAPLVSDQDGPPGLEPTFPESRSPPWPP